MSIYESGNSCCRPCMGRDQIRRVFLPKLRRRAAAVEHVQRIISRCKNSIFEGTVACRLYTFGVGGPRHGNLLESVVATLKSPRAGPDFDGSNLPEWRHKTTIFNKSCQHESVSARLGTVNKSLFLQILIAQRRGRYNLWSVLSLEIAQIGR